MFINLSKMDYGFCDLCVNMSENKQNLKQMLFKLYNAGYKTVVLNQNIDESIFDNEKKKKKKSDEKDVVSVPEPININGFEQEFRNKLNILNRITFSFSDSVKTHFLNQLPVLKKYNLYAVVPKTQTAFQHACSQLNVDIILINSTCSGLKLSRKLYLQAAERGIHFEVQYSNVIKSSNRKTTIHYSHLFYTFGKSKNLIISSGADDPFFIRNPYDVINLARLLGLNETKAKFSICQQAHHAILKGEGRRCGKAMFKIQCKNEVDELEDNSCDAKTKKIKISNIE